MKRDVHFVALKLRCFNTYLKYIIKEPGDVFLFVVP